MNLYLKMIKNMLLAIFKYK